MPTAPPPRLPSALLRALLPIAEREEVLGDLREEYGRRRSVRGRAFAAVWLWRQVLGSAPALLRRSWWRGWTGFEPAVTPIRQYLVGSLKPALLATLAAMALTTKLPLRGSGDSWGITIEGRPDLPDTTTYVRFVSLDYFRTLGIAVRAGRGFTDADRTNGERVVMINEALAKKYFPGIDPIGRRLRTASRGWERIAGVVEDVAEANLTDGPEPARYLLADQFDYTPEQQTLVLRTERPADAAAVLDAARKAVQRVAPGVAVREATTMERVFDKAVGPARQIMTLLSLLTGLALVLGAIGVYGVIAHHVSRRKRDYSIRVALGLQPARVLRQVVGQGAALVSLGIVVGVVASIVLARFLASLLYGVRAADPVALTAATLALLAVGVLAALVPAYRASRVDPARACASSEGRY